MLGPMVNPSRPSKQMIGVFSLELVRLYAYLYQNHDIRFSIVHSLDGYDEISLTGDFKISSSLGEKLISPDEIGMSTLTQDSIKGGNSIAESARVFENVLKGKGTDAQASVVTANAAAALQTADPTLSFIDAIAKTEEALKSGRALKMFKALVEPKTTVSMS